MSWLGILVATVAIVIAFKVIGLLLRLSLWGVALVALYWFAAPYLGWPTLAELIDTRGRAGVEAIQQRSSGLAAGMAGAAVDQVTDRMREQLSVAADRIAPPDDAAVQAETAAARPDERMPVPGADPADSAMPQPLPEPEPADDADARDAGQEDTNAHMPARL